MSEASNLLLFIFCLVAGTVLLFLGRGKGQSWLEAFKPTALLFGLSGFSGGQYFLEGKLEFVITLLTIVPAIGFSVMHSRQLLFQQAKTQLPGSDSKGMTRGEKAVAQAIQADHVEANNKLRRRLLRTGVMLGLPVLGVGVFYGSWSAVPMGCAVAGMVGLTAMFVTQPLKEAVPSATDRALGEAPVPETLPAESDE